MTETASLIIKVDSRGAKSASADLDKLTAGAGKAEKATGALTGAWKVLTAVAASAALAKAVTSYIRMADASANMAARLRLATRSQEEFNVAHKATFEIAQRTSTELASVVDLYAKLSQSTGELGVSQGDLLRLTEAITQTFQISGATAQEAAGGLRQLSQAMAGGVLRAEEFNSIIESSPRLVKALADGMGIEFGKVRQYVNEGKISSEQLVQALLSQSQAIQSEFDQMPLTVGRALQEVRNALTGLVGGADEASGATSGLAGAIQDLARTLESQEVRGGFQSFVSGVVTATSKLAEFLAKSAEVARFWGEEVAARRGGAAFDDPIRLEQERERIQARIKELAEFQSRGRIGQAVMGSGRVDPYAKWRDHTLAGAGGDMADKAEREMAILTGRLGEIARAQSRALMDEVAGAFDQRNDFARNRGLPDDFGLNFDPNGRANATATADIKDRTAARRELTAEEKEWLEFQKDLDAHEQVASDRLREVGLARIQTAQEQADAIERQRQATAGLIEELEFEASLYGKSVAEQEEMIALRLAGANATEEQREKIKGLVRTIREGREAESDMLMLRDGARSLFGTIVTDSARASDALNRFFDNLKARAADKLFEGLLSGFAGMAGGGGWAGFAQGFGKGWAGGGRAAGGPVQGGGAYLVGEHGPELFTPGQSGRVHPVGGAAGGQQSVVVNVHNAPAGTRVEQSRGANGGMQIDVLLDGVKKMVASDIASGGPTAAAIKGRFGLREAV